MQTVKQKTQPPPSPPLIQYATNPWNLLTEVISDHKVSMVWQGMKC